MRAFLVITIQLLVLLFQSSSPLAAATATPPAGDATDDDGAFYIVRRPVAQQPQQRSLSISARASTDAGVAAVAFSAGGGEPGFDETVAAIQAAAQAAPASAVAEVQTSSNANNGSAPAGASTRQSWGNPSSGQWNCVVRAGYEYCGGRYWGAASPGAHPPARWAIVVGVVGVVGAMAAWP